MLYLKEPAPSYDVATAVGPGIRRIVAQNPGLMTYHGTNTYLIDRPGGTAVADPGPDDPRHVEAILAATGGQVSEILLTHTHPDHFGAVVALKAATGAPILSFHKSANKNFSPDIPLADGDHVSGIRVIHTPGHASDHVCFALADGFLFSGDHVMSWSSSVVSPPQGDMAAYFASLRRLLARDDAVFLPGHGPPLPQPAAYVRSLLHHRETRERAILDILQAGPMDPPNIAELLYAKQDIRLRPAAQRNVIAHLLKLEGEGLVTREGEVWLSR